MIPFAKVEETQADNGMTCFLLTVGGFVVGTDADRGTEAEIIRNQWRCDAEAINVAFEDHPVVKAANRVALWHTTGDTKLRDAALDALVAAIKETP